MREGNYLVSEMVKKGQASHWARKMLAISSSSLSKESKWAMEPTKCSTLIPRLEGADVGRQLGTPACDPREALHYSVQL